MGSFWCMVTLVRATNVLLHLDFYNLARILPNVESAGNLYDKFGVEVRAAHFEPDKLPADRLHVISPSLYELR